MGPYHLFVTSLMNIVAPLVSTFLVLMKLTPPKDAGVDNCKKQLVNHQESLIL